VPGGVWRPEPVPVTASTTIHPIKNTATARISAVLALISLNFLCFIRQKTGAAHLLFRVPALHVRRPAFSPVGEGARRFRRTRAEPSGRARASAKPLASMPRCASPSIATAIRCSRSGCRCRSPQNAVGTRASRWRCPCKREHQEETMGRGILLWLLGVPIPVIILLWLFFGH
jgi:hypothetical protein